ncbi:MAG: hypothetical protein ACKV2T_02845 [Kofleriaceae bacterium]
MRRVLQVVVAFAVSVPAIAHAGVYDIHLGGMCSTQFEGGKGGGYLGSWPGETSVSAYVDQRDSMATATQQFANTLDTYCRTGSGNICYVYSFSNGGAVFSRTMAMFEDGRWNIGYHVASASNEGGSEIGGTGFIGEIFGGCYLAGHIGPSNHRNGWNHHDSNGVVTGMISGNGWLAPYAQSSLLPGHDDGAVAAHSAGGYASTGSFNSSCGAGKYTARQAWWSCEYGSLNHSDLKMKGICNDGGATGCKN